MAGEALGWYQWMHHNRLISTWEDFTCALELRFGPSEFENHQQALFKLHQTTTVSDYQKEFERFYNQVIGLPHPAILDCFISRLKPVIQHELAILQPTTISQAIGYAKLVETKISASKAISFSNPRPFFPRPSPQPPPHTNPPSLPTPPARLALPAPPTPHLTPYIKKIPLAEMQTRKAKGLCYNCDEKFHNGHRCKSRQFILLLSDEDSPNDIVD